MADPSSDLIEDVVEADTRDGPMAVIVKQPADGHRGTVVIFHDAPGIRDATHVFGRKLASAGYRIVVPDLYHRHGRLIGFNPADAAADPTVSDRLRELLVSLTDDGIQADLDAALEAIGDESGPAAGLGFCLGARAVFRTMMRLPERFVVGAAWHPSFLVDDQADSPHVLADTLPGSLYLGFAENDTIMSLASMRPFIDAVSRRHGKTVIDVHPDADHGFTWADSPRYNQAAADRSFRQTDVLFREALS